MKKNTRIAVKAMAVILLVALAYYLHWGNTALELTTYSVASKELPPAFDGFRIVQVSDLHNAEMGKENERLLTMLKEAQPDLIAITGDMIDSRRTDTEIAVRFAQEAVKIAPCYYVTGNHEARAAVYDEFREDLAQAGVTVLEDERIEIERAGERIALIGVHDPMFNPRVNEERAMSFLLRMLAGEEKGFTVLLSHRPELFNVYVESGVNLVLSGHAHGGQIRLPLVGGVLVPNQGLLPEYDAGCFAEKRTTMIVSRGIGNSLFPLRVNNRPEVVFIELICTEN